MLYMSPYVSGFMLTNILASLYLQWRQLDRHWPTLMLGMLLSLLPVLAVAASPPQLTQQNTQQHTQDHSPNSPQPTKVFYPGTPRSDYYIDLLKLALSYPCPQRFELQASNLDLPKKRAFDLMNAGQGIDVMYGSASIARVAEYRAVPFPLMRGLMGLRVALVSKNGADTLKHIYTQSALARLRVGQFATWSDTEILRANQFNLEAGSDLDGLYQMLARGRIDYFPRSVLEVQHNQQQYQHLQLQIDAHILLYYPTAVYFYVAKDNKALADTLLCGLEQAQRDGKFNQLFQQYYGGLIQQLQLDKRRVFKLHNPLLPDNVPLERPELWYPVIPQQ